MEDTTAAAFLFTYGTAHHALCERGHLRAGETLLVLGAAGGVGLAAVEVGKAVGARVIACASTGDKLAVCRAHGADATINYTTGNQLGYTWNNNSASTYNFLSGLVVPSNQWSFVALVIQLVPVLNRSCQRRARQSGGLGKGFD